MSRPTMETVAERAGVSRALVSLVMNNSPKVSDTKRQAVLEAAAELGYRPNLHARSLAQQRTKTLGMIINDIHNPFFAEVVYGVEAAAEAHGLEVLILNGGRDAERERRAVETHLQFQVEALILVGPKLDDDDIIRASAVVPTVVVASGATIPGPTRSPPTKSAAALAVQHLVELGHTDIVHIDGAPTSPHARSPAMRRPCARSARAANPARRRRRSRRRGRNRQPRRDRFDAHRHFAFNDLVAAARSAPSKRQGCGFPTTCPSSGTTTRSSPSSTTCRSRRSTSRDTRWVNWRSGRSWSASRTTAPSPPVSTSHRPCRCGGRRRRPKGLT